MKKIILILVFILVPSLTHGSVAGDFTVNPQSTYDIPYGTEKVLILDLNLPEPLEGEKYQLKSIILHSAGTADHLVISKLEIWEDGPSVGWDQDETEAARVLQAPFFDTPISGNFRPYSGKDSWRRIFVTVDIQSGEFINEKTLRLQLLKNSAVFTSSILTGPTDGALAGPIRIIRRDAPIPTVPLSPMVKTPEVISASAIRWHFSDLSNNEFGFKILDNNLKTVATGGANISYLDETDLQPDTEYSGRQVGAFNDRGQSSVSTLTVFPTVRTLPQPEPVVEVVEEEVIEEPAPAETGGPLSAEELRALIQEIQQKIIELLQQLIQLLQEQISAAQASLFRAFEAFTDWLEARFR